jgi:hypothetical protein
MQDELVKDMGIKRSTVIFLQGMRSWTRNLNREINTRYSTDEILNTEHSIIKLQRLVTVNNKEKVKLSLYLTKHHAMKAY